MRNRGIILYGPPASGKDAATRALTAIDPTCRHFTRLKIGNERTTGYEIISPVEASALRQRGQILYENTRYGNHYIVDRPRLADLFRNNFVPIVHLGQVAGVQAVSSYSADWVIVLLWCSREVAKRRLSDRGSTDVAARLAAWDETMWDIEQNAMDNFDLHIDTERHYPTATAELILSYLTVHPGV